MLPGALVKNLGHEEGWDVAMEAAGLAVCGEGFRKLLEEARRVARYPSTVLIEGETGVGKEVVADFIHRNSPRAKMPFTKVNCASIPETLLESELFGYERGAFTGAKREGSPGLFELTDKGTLLLDEIAELSPLLQAKLLRVLQDRVIRRVGGSWTRSLDVRVIASTNQPLRDLVRQGRFRADLFYRLHVVRIVVPPLRERKDEIPGLLAYYMDHFNREFGQSKQMSPGLVQQLCQYDYPGNVRELRNIVESLYVRSPGPLIDGGQVLAEILASWVGDNSAAPVGVSPGGVPTLAETVAGAERRAIEWALGHTSSVRAAAAVLGVSHTTLLRKMRRLGITDAR
ncbi:sigma54 specific transcriptional regulator, Fis family [Kyrpidia tusciae DSM 2912]|uniref:HTH-type transcriptional regulatory protein TyrR n=2 Tax=Kyrpidia TaxID=1129704 RepID=D5WY33_KYRT2|nr:sigma54 specific transcriptional regulator, Fis family [Kyrpidia tusciae DSM 2912]